MSGGKRIVDAIEGLRGDVKGIEAAVDKLVSEKGEVAAQGFHVTEQKGTKDAVMRVKEYDSSYVGDLSLATDIYHAQQLGMKLRQLEVQLKGGTVAFDSGQFLESTGKLEIGRASLNPMELIRGVIRKMNDETFFRPTISGSGTVTLDSSFKFITLFPVEERSRVVLEKGIYLASIGDFEFKTTKNLNPGYLIFSDKGMFQTDVRGVGVIALELPVHRSELVEREVTPDNPLLVNGNYVLIWSGNLKRTVKPAGSLFGSLASGVGLVEEYTGTGKVWIAPTLGYYRELAKDLEGDELGGDRHEEIRGTQKGKRENTWWQTIFTRR